MQTREQLQFTLEQLVCPVCHGRLRLDAATVNCGTCFRQYPLEDSIPVLLEGRAHIPGDAPSL